MAAVDEIDEPSPTLTGITTRGLSSLERVSNPAKAMRLSLDSDTRTLAPLTESTTDFPPTAINASHLFFLNTPAISLTRSMEAPVSTSSMIAPMVMAESVKPFLTPASNSGAVVFLSVTIKGRETPSIRNSEGRFSKAVFPETILTGL